MPKLQTTAQIDCVVQTIMTVQCTSSYADYSGLLVSVDFYSKNHPWRESSLRPIRYSGGEDSRTIVLRSPYVLEYQEVHGFLPYSIGVRVQLQ
jgi:hypothetical protein